MIWRLSMRISNQYWRPNLTRHGLGYKHNHRHISWIKPSLVYSTDTAQTLDFRMRQQGRPSSDTGIVRALQTAINSRNLCVSTPRTRILNICWPIKCSAVIQRWHIGPEAHVGLVVIGITLHGRRPDSIWEATYGYWILESFSALVFGGQLKRGRHFVHEAVSHRRSGPAARPGEA